MASSLSTPSLPPRLLLSPAVQILILGFSAAIGLGICRFAYALVLPDMRDSLGWSYSAAGFMNTANAAGYLAGALSAAIVIKRVGLFRTVWLSAVACVVSLILSGVTSDFVWLSLARALSGITGAFIFVAGSAMAATMAQMQASRAAFLLSLFYTGPAIGIVVSGLLAPLVLAWHGPGSWWLVWLALALVSAIFTALLPLARSDLQGGPAHGSAAGFTLRPVLAMLAGYFLFGAGYIAYMTFMIAFVRDAGGGPLAQGLFWTLIGIGAFVAPWFWAGLIARYSNGRATAILTVVTMIGAILPLLSSHPVTLAISALIFGNAFFAVVSSITVFIRRNFAPAAWPQGIAVATVAFSLGQMLGPIATGAITDITGSLLYALIVSAALLAVSALVAAAQRALA